MRVVSVIKSKHCKIDSSLTDASQHGCLLKQLVLYNFYNHYFPQCSHIALYVNTFTALCEILTDLNCIGTQMCFSIKIKAEYDFLRRK